jgi:hypothetical protein
MFYLTTNRFVRRSGCFVSDSNFTRNDAGSNIQFYNSLIRFFLRFRFSRYGFVDANEQSDQNVHVLFNIQYLYRWCYKLNCERYYSASLLLLLFKHLIGFFFFF